MHGGYCSHHYMGIYEKYCHPDKIMQDFFLILHTLSEAEIESEGIGELLYYK